MRNATKRGEKSAACKLRSHILEENAVLGVVSIHTRAEIGLFCRDHQNFAS